MTDLVGIDALTKKGLKRLLQHLEVVVAEA